MVIKKHRLAYAYTLQIEVNKCKYTYKSCSSNGISDLYALITSQTVPFWHFKAGKHVAYRALQSCLVSLMSCPGDGAAGRELLASAIHCASTAISSLLLDIICN